jgi:hypothetical protein
MSGIGYGEGPLAGRSFTGAVVATTSLPAVAGGFLVVGFCPVILAFGRSPGESDSTAFKTVLFSSPTWPHEKPRNTRDANSSNSVLPQLGQR